MSESSDHQEIINNWASPEAQALLQRQLLEDLSAGVYRSYIHAMDTKYLPGEYWYERLQPDLSEHARREGHLIAFRDRRVETTEDGLVLDHLFLDKVNALTGETYDDGDVHGIVFVASMEEDGQVHDFGKNFTTDQITLIRRHAGELEQADLEYTRVNV